jgi:RHS repeat-associated protein
MTWTSGGTTLADYSYTYDDNNNVLSRTVGWTGDFDNSLSQTYSYDSLNELTGYAEGTISGGTITSPSRGQSIDYDSLGNVTSNTTTTAGVSSTETRSANAQNEYTSISSATTPTYDNNGNMTTDSTGLKYIYDAWNRLVKVENSAGTSTLETFAYDGLGRRIVADVGGTTTVLFYSAVGQVLEESSGGDYTNRYVWSPVYVNALVLRDSMVEVGPTLRLWVIQDANWNVVALVNASGSVVERFDYTPFGSVTQLNPDASAYTGTNYNWVYLWQGGWLDTVSGNLHFGARDYNLVLMRWMTNDPIGLWGGDPSTYRTEGNDVTGAVDPSGLDFWTREANDTWLFRTIASIAPETFSPPRMAPAPPPPPDPGAGVLGVDDPDAPAFANRNANILRANEKLRQLGLEHGTENYQPESIGGAVLGATGGSFVRIGARWQPRSITDPRIGGDIKVIQPPKGAKFLGKYRGQTPGWNDHWVVVKDGRVYDAFTGHAGLPIDEYKLLWESHDVLQFGF